MKKKKKKLFTMAAACLFNILKLNIIITKLNIHMYMLNNQEKKEKKKKKSFEIEKKKKFALSEQKYM